jgi:hypothetical protein
MLAYKNHFNDARRTTGDRVYHSNSLGEYPGEPNLPLEDETPPKTWLDVARRLNDIQKRYNWHLRSFKGHPRSIVTQGVTLTNTARANGFSLTFTGGAVAGAEVVSVVGSRITVQVQTGVSTVTQVRTAVNASAVAAALVTASGTSATTIVIAAEVFSADGADEITATNILNAEVGPDFEVPTPSYDPFFKLVDFGNSIKTHFNSHLASISDAHKTTTTLGAFGGVQDVANTIALPNATTRYTLIELAGHLFAAYRAHRDDAVVKVFRTMGSLYTAAGSRKKIDNISARAISEGGNANYQDIVVGMYATTESGGSQFLIGTKVASIVGDDALTDADHDDFAGADATVKVAFSLKKYHSISSNSATHSATELQADVSIFAASISDFNLAVVLLDIATKFNLHDASAYYHAIGSLYQVDLEKYPEPHPYVYGFAYYREYLTSDGKTRKDISSVLQKTFIAFEVIEKKPQTIGSMPVLTNSATENYITTTTRVAIYRTKDSQTLLRMSGNIVNGTARYVDSTTDESLDSNEVIYTAGGVVDNDPPPIAKVIHEHDGFGFYGNLKVGDEYFPNAIAQSIPENLDAVPESFLTLLPGPVIGISSTTREKIAWTKSGTYRIEGTFDERGQGGSIAVEISDQVGLVSGVSPVKTDLGVVFAGTDGFYLCDGYKLIPLSGNFRGTYIQLVQSAAQARRINGTYDKINRRVIWACSSDGDENDTLFVLHMAFGLVGSGGAFSTRSGGGSFRPSAICMFDNQLIRGDSRGYILKHNDDYSDPEIDPDVSPADWVQRPVYFDYRSPNFDFGSKKYRKFVTKIGTFFENVGKLTCQIFRINDHGKSTKELKRIEFSGVPVGSLEEKRYMPAGNLRCMTCQVQITNKDDGQTDEKVRITAYTLAYQPLGDSVKDVQDDALEVANS